MALPVANLGYMPNLSTPSSPGVHMKGPNAWEQLAQAVAQGLLTQGVQNLTSRDYTTQAQAERLAVDPAAKQASFLDRLLQGPTTSKDQISELRREKAATKRTGMAEGGATYRTERTLKSNEGQSDLDRLFKSTSQDKDILSREELARTNIRAQQGEGNLDRLSREGMQRDALTNALQRERMGNETSTTNAGIMAGGLANQAKMGTLYNQLQNSAEFRKFMNPNDPARPITAEEIQAFISRFQQGPR